MFYVFLLTIHCFVRDYLEYGQASGKIVCF